jgi:general secretion pathway protein C
VGEGIPDPRAILARNVFDPETGPLWPPPPPPADEPEPDELAAAGDGRCETELRIAAASYDGLRPERSWVVLRGPDPGSGRPYLPGMAAFEHTVLEVLPTAVRLQTAAGGTCWIGMFTDGSREKVAHERALAAEANKAKTRKAARARRKARGRAFSDEELSSGIRKVDDTRYVLRDELVDAAVERAAKLAAATRVAPARWRDRVIGLRLLRMHKDGFLSRIGLKRGDILRKVNGYELDSGADVLEAYARMGSARRITLAIKRGRKYVSLDYTVQ